MDDEAQRRQVVLALRFIRQAQQALGKVHPALRGLASVTKRFQLSKTLVAEITIDLTGLPSVKYQSCVPALNSDHPRFRESRISKAERQELVRCLDEMDWRLLIEANGGDGATFDLDALPEFRNRLLDVDPDLID